MTEKTMYRLALIAIVAALIYGLLLGANLIALVMTIHDRADDARIARVQQDLDLATAIADMREAVFQQDERVIGAVRWCLSKSPDPKGCVAWSLENTR